MLGIRLCLELGEDRIVLGLVRRALLLLHHEEEVGVVVPVSGGHLQAGQVLGIATQQDVDASPGHVRGDRDRALPAGLGDDRGFLLMVLRVQDLVRDAAAVEDSREPLGLLDGDRAYQNGLPRFVPFKDVVGDRVPLRVLVLVDEVLLVLADHVAVGRDLDHADLVRLLELGQLGLSRTGHPAQLVVHLEVVLDGDGGERLVLFLDPHAFLGLDRLVQAFAVPSPLKDSPGELIDDLDLSLLDHVGHVAPVELLSPQRVVEVVDQR